MDYFGKYFTEEAFDFTGLINDDFFQPVRILFNEKHYVSSVKLLLVAVDSMSYLEYGDIKENTFIKWLKEYSEIGKLGITAEELWEQRNSLLHMSNLDSRKVKSGCLRRLIAYVGKSPKDVELNNKDTGYYEIYQLILVIGDACGAWLRTYAEERSKIDSFVERYDLIASDARMMWVQTNEETDC